MCIERITSEISAKELGDIWNQYHITKDCISASIPCRSVQDTDEASQEASHGMLLIVNSS